MIRAILRGLRQHYRNNRIVPGAYDKPLDVMLFQRARTSPRFNVASQTADSTDAMTTTLSELRSFRSLEALEAGPTLDEP